ncbi:uncharacterized protein F4822DRAFT_444330 [Hypoxylon trugodes]|uniref:uncharacterized protein n=1 Tax=Hypoxylon trugodes TaxID=326681 RepID=UPI00219C26F7|nr:uncharacterized protein F4822DRAFT_444330 [Hypoxylon trugodes]KAI1387732.1 hypothetical protein F4822DRAFT_444330 [Hypoxylon trugodes]
MQNDPSLKVSLFNSRTLTSSDLPSIERCFRFLFYAAVVLLWGASVLNGTIKALLVAAWVGHLENGIPLKTAYTGLFLLDYPLSVLVAFFFHGTSGRDEGYSIFLFDLYITLQLGYLWLYAESIRPGKKPIWVQNPIYIALLWQACGGAVAMPLYFGVYTSWASRIKPAQIMDIHKARALPVTFALGAVAPMLFLMAPTWLGPEVRSPTTQQLIIAVFQPSPILASLLTSLVSRASAYLSGAQNITPKIESHDNEASSWIQRAYLIGAAASIVGHFYVLTRIFIAVDSNFVNTTRMYLPFPISGPAHVTDVLARGSFLFLKWDNIILGLANLTWALVLLGRTPTIGIILAFAMWSIALGPGTVVTIVLYLRESRLPRAKDEIEKGE